MNIGTKEYTDGIYDAVTILIGIAKAGVPLAGVVFEPWYVLPILLAPYSMS